MKKNIKGRFEVAVMHENVAVLCEINEKNKQG